jgi:hypothetical protein
VLAEIAQVEKWINLSEQMIPGECSFPDKTHKTARFYQAVAAP